MLLAYEVITLKPLPQAGSTKIFKSKITEQNSFKNELGNHSKLRLAHWIREKKSIPGETNSQSLHPFSN